MLDFAFFVALLRVSNLLFWLAALLGSLPFPGPCTPLSSMLAAVAALLAVPRRDAPTALAAGTPTFIAPTLSPATRLNLLLQAQSVTTAQLAFIM